MGLILLQAKTAVRLPMDFNGGESLRNRDCNHKNTNSRFGLKYISNCIWTDSAVEQKPFYSPVCLFLAELMKTNKFRKP